MAIVQSNGRERAGAAAGAVLVQLALFYVLIVGLAGGVLRVRESGLAIFDVPPPVAPVARVVPAVQHRDRAEGAAPRNLRATPSEVVAPAPAIPLPATPAAPVAGAGNAPAAGASDLPGPGTGAGGIGNGNGSGSEGDGDGDGGTALRWKSGRIKDSDYPRDALRAGIGGTVHLRFTVGVKGRVTDCVVTQSSGSALLDATTCRLIVARFRYEPSRDAQGRAVPDVVTGEHVWETWSTPPPAPGQ
jgi:protein TonB